MLNTKKIDDLTMRRSENVAHIAKVHDRCVPVFCQRIALLVSQVSNESVTKKRDHHDPKESFKRIDAACKKLTSALTPVGYYIDAMLHDSGSKTDANQIKQQLLELQRAAFAAKSDIEANIRPGRPTGLRTPFDAFVFRLIKSARSNGGKLTIYKVPKNDPPWGGSLVEALHELMPALPPNFLPKGKSLFSSLDRVATIAGRTRKTPAK